MKSPGPLRRHLCFLDVEHGNSTVLIAGEESVVVVDVGRQSTLSEFLLEQEITHINSIYLSHADADHIGALVGILATELSIDRVFLNSDASKNTSVWDDLVYELNARHQAGVLEFEVALVPGRAEELQGGVCLHVLGPSRYLVGKGVGGIDRRGVRIRSNSISAVISITVASSRLALLPGDIDGVGLNDLLESCDDLRARILIYPHHGAGPGAIDPADYARTLLGAVDPEIVVFSIGREQYATPSPATVQALRETLPNTRIVCTQLSQHCARQLPIPAPIHLSQAFARGRVTGRCCGGTIVVPLDHFRFHSSPAWSPHRLHPLPRSDGVMLAGQRSSPWGFQLAIPGGPQSFLVADFVW